MTPEERRAYFATPEYRAKNRLRMRLARHVHATPCPICDHSCGWQGCPTILSDPYQLLCRYHQKQP